MERSPPTICCTAIYIYWSCVRMGKKNIHYSNYLQKNLALVISQPLPGVSVLVNGLGAVWTALLLLLLQYLFALVFRVVLIFVAVVFVFILALIFTFDFRQPHLKQIELLYRRMSVLLCLCVHVCVHVSSHSFGPATLWSLRTY